MVARTPITTQGFVGLEKNAMGQGPEGSGTAEQEERRRHARYRLCERLLIRCKDGTSHQAVTSDISISGLSASTTAVLQIGERVELSPVADAHVSAIVRHKSGTVYGFEFTELPWKVVEEIHKLCRGLVPIRGLSELQGS